MQETSSLNHFALHLGIILWRRPAAVFNEELQQPKRLRLQRTVLPSSRKSPILNVELELIEPVEALSGLVMISSPAIINLTNTITT